MKRILRAGALMLLLMILVLASACKKAPEKPTDPPREMGEIHTDLQLKALKASNDRILQFADGRKERSWPEPVILDFSDQDISGNSYVVEFSSNRDFSDAMHARVSEKQLPVTNLLLGTTYYWRAAADEAGLASAPVRQFTTTSAAPRNMYVDGVTNVRDLGGWKAGDRVVKQGMIYRGGRLNEDEVEVPVPEITAAGIETFTQVMKIHTELDLRRLSDNEVGGITASVVPGVDYILVDINSGTKPDVTKEEVRQIFELFATPEAYPIYFHCSIGTDRTVMIAAILNGLLGVAEEDLCRDYLFSNFGNIGSARQINTIENDVLVKIKRYEGATLQENIENYLLSCGVTPEQIATIRSLLLE
ncbi:MAG: tyrosine-protein phosphatase [Lachnospiraceae bacterium]|nr:tyrosine-protein phosphatase [Lachnospiraceae bacterium]